MPDTILIVKILLILTQLNHIRIMSELIKQHGLVEQLSENSISLRTVLFFLTPLFQQIPDLL